MLNYIATENTAKLIKQVCKNQNILILYETQNITNIRQYLKETKVNFNLVKYFIIELNNLDNTENEIIESIYKFNKLHSKIRIIILAQGLSDQSNLLNELYNNGIYNIINNSDNKKIQEELIKCLSNKGIQKTDAKRFERIEEKVKKDKKINILKSKLKEIYNILKKNDKTLNSKSAYFFRVLIKVISEFVKIIYWITKILLIYIGIKILFNSQLREIILQILKVK